MTPIGAIIAGIGTIIAWYLGMKIERNYRKMAIEYRDARIKTLQDNVDFLNRMTDSLFNEADMSKCYYAGMAQGTKWKANNEYTFTPFPEWLKKNYKPVEKLVPDILGNCVHEPEDIPDNEHGLTNNAC